MRSDLPVTVIIPAYNAATFITETLRSVSAQTYRNLDIVVVDDGSTDDTAELVERHGREEPRLRLIRQANAGVATARNVGIEQSTSPLIAPMDSDDLWHPTRIEKHVAALEQNPQCGYVYSPFRRVDEAGRILSSHPLFGFSGRVFFRQLIYNMIGNGSGMTIRREAALAVGCYDTRLDKARIQGCEDWLFQSMLARDYEVAQVPEYLIGYRRSPGAMSNDTHRMWRSQIFACELLIQMTSAAARPFIEAAQLQFSTKLALLGLKDRNPLPIIGTVVGAVRRGQSARLAHEFGEVLERRARRRPNPPTPGLPFLEVDTIAAPPQVFSPLALKTMEWLREADETLSPGADLPRPDPGSQTPPSVSPTRRSPALSR